MFGFEWRPGVFHDIVEDGGGSSGKTAFSMKNVLQPVVGAVTGSVTAQQAIKDAERTRKEKGVGDIAQNNIANKTGLTVASNKGGGTQKVSYIGNNGAKTAGTTAASGSSAVTPGTTPDYYKQMQTYYQRMYDDQVAANNTALEATRQRAQETTDAQIAALGEQYAGVNRQLYRDYMNSRRALPQQLAAQGYSGGLSESSMLRLANAYAEGLNENERSRIAQETGYNQALAQQLFEAQLRANEANARAGQQRYSNLAAIQDAIYKDTQQRAATMAAAGDFTEYSRLGFSKSEIAYLKDMWKRMNPQLQ